MLKNYFRIAWRSLLNNKLSSFINISGLAAGMAVAMLIGLWIWDELSFNKYHDNYDHIATVMENGTYNNVINTISAIPLPLDNELRKNYGNDFTHIALASFTERHILIAGDKKIPFKGNFMGAEAPEVFTLHMLKGTRNGLQGPSSIFISHATANALFGSDDPLGKIITLDNKGALKVSGVYDDLPANTTLHDLAFIGSWEYYIHAPGNARSLTDWSDNSLFLYVQTASHTSMAALSEKIKDIKLNAIGATKARTKPQLFLQPMSKWHLYAQFKNGVNTGGAIQYVWLFGIIGAIVLLLACINFMNLSTARSEKRAREVGIRKTLGSVRGQLIGQFFCESFLIAVLSFVLSLGLVLLLFPAFKNLYRKKKVIPWGNPLFWAACAGFTAFTGLVAGSYPALYLSSFNPVRVLKGRVVSSPYASIPRQGLVILQFTVSVSLIICTIIVFKQILFAQDRPVGYTRDGLVNIRLTNDDLTSHFEAVRTGLQQSGAIMEVAASSSPLTGINNKRSDLDWKGKDPSVISSFGWISVTTEYGKTVGWLFKAGRDFSTGFLTDSSAAVLNEAAVKHMGLKNPVGETIKVGKRNLLVIGVVQDMVMESPYDPVKPTVFHLGDGNFDDLLVKINPSSSARDGLAAMEKVFKAYSPSIPFSYRFASDEYAQKFVTEQRVGKLAGSFALLTVFISCLGLFGMASFMAERRIKEIGVRKVMGASVLQLWGLMNKAFVTLVLIALLIAIPVAYLFMRNWLAHYEYHSDMPWWIFAAAGGGALLITVLTVSYQGIKTALTNPVKSLRTE